MKFSAVAGNYGRRFAEGLFGIAYALNDSMRFLLAAMLAAHGVAYIRDSWSPGASGHCLNFHTRPRYWQNASTSATPESGSWAARLLSRIPRLRVISVVRASLALCESLADSTLAGHSSHPPVDLDVGWKDA